MSGTKILFLEDNKLYQESIKDFLEEEEFIVETCSNGQEFLNKIFENIYDLYLLDINVPQINGFELMKILSDYNDTTMKLVLSSFPESMLQSFKNGCDDFINKTSDIDELLLRIKTLIKRDYHTYQESIQIANNVNYDLLHKKLYINQKKIELDIRSLLVLDYLIKNREKFVSSLELENSIYPCNSRSNSNVIRYYIWSLRKILGKEIIESKKNFGYRLTSVDLFVS
ncbi:response regulator transcription factor [Sulfurovum mangrovi]|uniref:response regulator transcription factor n=1 Tax=Sulfurovum mangrovi TaxID=2893889 RepID=UPI001E5BDA32|nr:response regulator transcription factor [Sulfurovum mangrovi]UFH58250.1 response regulator transcription factor [Sulfurovum mangrovi]